MTWLYCDTFLDIAREDIAGYLYYYSDQWGRVCAYATDTAGVIIARYI